MYPPAPQQARPPTPYMPQPSPAPSWAPSPMMAPAQYGGNQPMWQQPQGQQQNTYPQAGFSFNTGPSPFFDDPLTQPIMSSWTQRMSQLSQPGPGFGEAQNILRRGLKEDPRLTNVLSTIQGGLKRSAPPNAYLKQYAASTTNRMKELNADPFSSSDEAALKAQFFDDLARTRDDRTDQLRQRLASMGIAPTSGTAQEAGALLEGEYEGARASQQRDLLKYVTDERNRRRDLAVTMSGGLSQHGATEAANQTQWEGQRANIASNLAQLLNSLGDRRVSIAGQLAGLQQQAYGNDMARGEMHLGTSALPAQLGQQRMQQMQQILAGFGSPQQLYEQQLAQQRQQDEAKRYADANKTAMWGGIGQVAAPILGAAAKSWFK